jgi:hypothetical protein
MFVKYRLGYQLLLVLALCEFALAFSFGVTPFVTYFAEGGFIRTMLPAWLAIPLVFAAPLAVLLVKRKIDRPLVAARRVLYRHRHRLARCLVFALILLFLARSFTSFKLAIPRIVPFYADPWLAQLDAQLFGADPWRLTHAVIGPVGTVIIDQIYATWFVIMLLLVGWFCFTANQRLQLRGLFSYLMIWGVLGNAMALGLASVGPCFYDRFFDSPRFVPLLDQLQAIDARYGLLAVDAMGYLASSVDRDNFGAGISAMPSLHVAIAFLGLLVAREYARRWWVRLGAALFFVAILIGSVHLGWHYALDGLVSIVVTGAIWWASGRFVDWVEQREAAGVAPEIPHAPGDRLIGASLPAI